MASTGILFEAKFLFFYRHPQCAFTSFEKMNINLLQQFSSHFENSCFILPPFKYYSIFGEYFRPKSTDEHFCPNLENGLKMLGEIINSIHSD